MACAANYAWANRQMLMHWTREVFERVLQMSPRDLGLHLVYDVCHNIAKREFHLVAGERREVCVHRKGATRAFPPAIRLCPKLYRKVGQPVLIPGDMGRYSYVLVGTEGQWRRPSAAPATEPGGCKAGRRPRKPSKGRSLHRESEDEGIYVLAPAGQP